MYGREISEEEAQLHGNFIVQLSSVGNPDHGQDPNSAMYGVPSSWARVDSLEDASTKCREYIAEHGLGGGNWSGGTVREWTQDKKANGRIVARVSYNGRIWEPGESGAQSTKARSSASNLVPLKEA